MFSLLYSELRLFGKSEEHEEVPMKKFEDFNMKSTTMDFIRLNGFTEPTPIQQEVIPAFLRGDQSVYRILVFVRKNGKYSIALFKNLERQD